MIAELFDHPERFDFFQAVRLLEHLARERSGGDPQRRRGPVGFDEPNREAVSFRADPSLGFPTATIRRLTEKPAPAGQGPTAPLPEMVVTFLGLFGPSGVLPRHYTELVLRRLREKDSSLRDFLDLFHHRLIGLFHRAWEKYRLPINYERSAIDRGELGADPITQGLYCLVGLGTAGLRDRRDVADEAFLHYAGHFAHHPRSSIALECLLQDFLGVSVRVLQTRGRWLALESVDLSLLPGGRNPQGRHNHLGVDLVVGRRVWDVQSKFRVRLGPLGWAAFRSFMPNGRELPVLTQVIRAYVGPELDFDVQPVLKAEEVPPCRLVPQQDGGPFLGWNTWLTSDRRTEAVDDAVFEARDF